MTNRIVTLSQAVTRAQQRVEALEQELQHIYDFDGTGSCSVSLSSKQRSVCINFGQLLENYEDHLIGALVTIMTQRIDVANTELGQAIKNLQVACAVDEVVGASDGTKEDTPWYPDLPGWTWYELEPGVNPNLPDEEIIEVLQRVERDKQGWVSCPDHVVDWIWDCKGEPYEKVTYATKNK